MLGWPGLICKQTQMGTAQNNTPYSKKMTSTEIRYWIIWGAFFHFILYLAYISYCLLCSLRTWTLSLCPRFSIYVQSVRVMCVDEAWLASREFSFQPACQVHPRTRMCLWVSYYHCVGVWLDIHLQPQKWKNVLQSQSLHNVMCAESLVKWERGFCFVSIQSNRKI